MTAPDVGKCEYNRPQDGKASDHLLVVAGDAGVEKGGEPCSRTRPSNCWPAATIDRRPSCWPCARSWASRTPSSPASAFKARIAAQEPVVVADAGAQVTVLVRVGNISDVTWPALGASDGRYQIRLGNHWLDSGGTLLVQDDGRAGLPADLEPSQEVEIPLAVTTPTEPGDYVLELDLVQESVAWFKDKGSQVTRIRFQVREMPKMEMHAIPKDEVLELIRCCGGKIVDVREDRWAGPEWIGFRYCVTKEPWRPGV